MCEMEKLKGTEKDRVVSGIVLEKICCTCLSTDRRLIQLSKENDGVNNLLFLISSDAEVYEMMFDKDESLLHICWECLAVMRRIRRFKEQTCIAQRQLTLILDKKCKAIPTSLSKLSHTHQTIYDCQFTSNKENIGQNNKCEDDSNDIKTEFDFDDVPLANINHDETIDSNNEDRLGGEKKEDLENDIKKHVLMYRQEENSINKKNTKLTKSVKKKNLLKKGAVISMNIKEKNSVNEKKMMELNNSLAIDNESEDRLGVNNKNEVVTVIKKHNAISMNRNEGDSINKEMETVDNIKSNEDIKNYEVIRMTEKELSEWMEKKRNEESFVNTVYKCDLCLKVFINEYVQEAHKMKAHSEKRNRSQCDICKVHINNLWVEKHKSNHYIKYQCKFCAKEYDMLKAMENHLNDNHPEIHKSTDNGLAEVTAKATESDKKIVRKKLNMGKKTPLGWVCTECGKCFGTYQGRYVHVMTYHRGGMSCSTCGKIFAYKGKLLEHERTHSDDPLPREPCPICNKMVRIDRKKIHAKIHTARKSYHCDTCDKTFVSHKTYTQHMERAKVHVMQNATKKIYECRTCDKQFIEQHLYLAHLRYSKLHVNEERRYKCTSCDKRFRSPGELRNHVNYAHMKQTEHKCPICDKALASKNCVKRHIRHAHDGEKLPRDKMCETCGKAFAFERALREHLLIHTGARPLNCDVCGDTFRQNAALYTHKRRVHKTAPLPNKVVHVSEITTKSTELHDTEDYSCCFTY